MVVKKLSFINVLFETQGNCILQTDFLKIHIVKLYFQNCEFVLLSVSHAG